MIRLGIIGTGGMAHSHAKAFGAVEGVSLAAACDVDPERLRAFSAEFSVPHTFTDWEALVSSGQVDAVTIVAPDALHAGMALGAIRAGLHVLCEKPLSTDCASATAMAREAQEAGVIHMVNFSYRRSSALHAARRIVASGRLGDVRHIRAEYLQSWLVSDAWGHWAKTDAFLWRLSTEHGSLGVLGDVGVHLLDFATFAVGGDDAELSALRCSLGNWSKNGKKRHGEYALDANDTALIELRLGNGALGVLQASRWTTGHLNTIRLAIHGTEGAIRMDLDDDYDSLEVCQGKDVHAARWRLRSYAPRPSIYALFVRAVSDQGKGRVSSSPDFVRGARVQNWLDTCFQSADADGQLMTPRPLGIV